MLVLAANAQIVFAAAQTANQIEMIAKVKRGVAKIGTGADARVTVTLRDNTKLKGFVSQAGDDDFTVTDRKTNNSQTISYADVAKIKGKNLSTLAKVGIGIGIGAAVYVVVIAIITKGFTKRILD